MADQSSLSLVQSLYVAYYGRPADPDGLAFWAKSLEDNGGNVNAILNDFGNSPEYTQRFSGLDDATLVNNLYQQLFGRDAEPEGLAFYTGLLAGGSQSLAEIAHTIGSIAQGVDRQVLEGRVQVANAFTKQLDTAEELQAYGTERGIEIGRTYLQEVTAVNGTVSVITKVVDVVATLLPSSPVPTPAPTPGGGGDIPAAPTFEVKTTGGVLEFAGTQTGPITASLLNDGSVEFVRGELKAVVSPAALSDVQVIQLGSASLTAPTSLVTGHMVFGVGSLQIEDVTAETDLSGVSGAVNVTAFITQPLNLSQASGLGSVDTFVIVSGVTPTLSVLQASHVVGAGTYSLQDSAGNLLAASANSLANAVSLAVDGQPSIAELTQLSIAKPVIAPMSYNSVSGTASELTADAAKPDGFVKADTDITVTDAIDISGLAAVHAVTSGTVIADNLVDTIGHLVSGSVAHPYITSGTNVQVTDFASVAEVQELDLANGDGTLAYSLLDTYASLRAADSLLVTGASEVALSTLDLGEVTVADIQAVLKAGLLNGTGGTPVVLSDLTYKLADAAFALTVRGAEDIVKQATDVTATTDATVAQAVVLYGLDTAATYNVADSARALVSGDATVITHAVDVTATTTANAVEAQVIQGLGGSIGKVTYSVADTFANLSANLDGANHAHNLTVQWNGSLTAAQANTAAAWINTGLTSLGSIIDTAASINTFVGAHAEGNTLTYQFQVNDSASNIINQLNSASDGSQLYFVKGNGGTLDGDQSVTSIHVNGAFSVSEAKTFWDAIQPVFGSDNSTATKTYYVISDALSAYTNTAVEHSSVQLADSRTVIGTAADVHAAQSNYLSPNHDIFDLLNAADHLNVSGSDGSQVIYGSKGSDFILVGNGDDAVYAGAGDDVIYGGAGADYLHGGAGRDTIYGGDSAADTSSPFYYKPTNVIVGGTGGDNMFGSSDYDRFVYEGRTKDALVAESGTYWDTRDYISNFSQGDSIVFQNVQNLQFLGSGSGNNASAVEAGTLGLSIRYDKGVNVQNWYGNGTVQATLVSIDIADAKGQFDNVADMHIVLVGNIDINASGNMLTFGA
ncbi:DUF4214 domain-containing protein [Pseudomonas sp. Marseille-QA0892]